MLLLITYVGVACASTASCVRQASSKLPSAYWSKSVGCSFPVSYLYMFSIISKIFAVYDLNYVSILF